MARPKTLKTCAFCAKEVYRIAGHGLCATCYYREKRNGTPAYVKVRKPCSIEGCEALSAAHGYCETHYRRWKRHGVAEHERFDRWGHVSKHPLAQSYYWLRSKEGANFPPEWTDFWQFVRDTGERPSARHKLDRVDKSIPIGPGNVCWRGPKFDIGSGENPQAYARLFAASQPRTRKAAVLKKVYGITIEQYDAMLEAQSGVCAICEKPEVTPNKATGLPRDLSVDHCHGKGHVRALLCSRCNAGLGNFNDDPVLLQTAINYLTRHKPDIAPPP